MEVNFAVLTHHYRVPWRKVALLLLITCIASAAFMAVSKGREVRHVLFWRAYNLRFSKENQQREGNGVKAGVEREGNLLAAMIRSSPERQGILQFEGVGRWHSTHDRGQSRKW